MSAGERAKQGAWKSNPVESRELSGPRPEWAVVLNSMANKRKTVQAADDGFLTTAAQAIGSTLGQLAVKVGVVVPPVKRKKAPVKKTAAVVKKRVVTKKKAVVKKRVRTK